MKKPKNKGVGALTWERVREVLDYRQEDGHFHWRIDRKSGLGSGRINARMGDRAGSVKHMRGYRYITIDYNVCAEHRLAFFWMTGSWPQYEVDHINGETADNSWINLRDIPRAINAQNMRRPMKSNRGNHLGVSSKTKWGHLVHEARIIVNGKYHHLGTFKSIEEASAAYVEAKRRLHPGGTL